MRNKYFFAVSSLTDVICWNVAIAALSLGELKLIVNTANECCDAVVCVVGVRSSRSSDGHGYFACTILRRFVVVAAVVVCCCRDCITQTSARAIRNKQRAERPSSKSTKLSKSRPRGAVSAAAAIIFSCLLRWIDRNCLCIACTPEGDVMAVFEKVCDMSNFKTYEFIPPKMVHGVRHTHTQHK